MLNSSAHLSHTVFDKNGDAAALRDGYGQGLLEVGKEENVVVLTGDLEESTRCHWFAKVYPERFFEMGVAEQNMAAVAAGLGVSGKIPFINSYATFSPGRNWEQIRTLAAYNNANVKIAGHHAGISTGPDGATHQAIEDVATMRAMPNMKVIVPCDAIEAQKATVAAAAIYGPMYIRLQREKTPVITTKETPFVVGKAQVFWIPKTKKIDVLIIGMGPAVYQAMEAARVLEKEHIASVVMNIGTIKPIDTKEVIAWVKKAGAVVTVEEHTIMGGLGSAVAEVLVRHCPVPMEMVGIADVFGQSGTPQELIKRYHLDVPDVVHAVKTVIKRK